MNLSVGFFFSSLFQKHTKPTPIQSDKRISSKTIPSFETKTRIFFLTTKTAWIVFSSVLNAYTKEHRIHFLQILSIFFSSFYSLHSRIVGWMSAHKRIPIWDEQNENRKNLCDSETVAMVDRVWVCERFDMRDKNAIVKINLVWPCIIRWFDVVLREIFSIENRIDSNDSIR